MIEKSFPFLAFSTPRRLPRASDLPGRVVVLDLAFAADGTGGASFEKTTLPFIKHLGDRLAMWVDHHDHVRHRDYANDPRFVLSTKAEHGACPEMVTPELVARAGRIETICCHGDFDGLCSAAKWIRDGVEPYPGADDDARAIDTRLGTPSDRADTLDRALRARLKDDGTRGLVVRFLAGGATDTELFRTLRDAGEELRALEDEARSMATKYVIDGDLAVCDARGARRPFDKTRLLLIGQERAPIALVHDENTVTVATPFDSGLNLLALLGIEGGMPTVVSVQAKDLERVKDRLRSAASSRSKPS